MSDASETWQLDWFIVPQEEGFRCGVSFKTHKKSNLKQHYEKFHQKMYKAISLEPRCSVHCAKVAHQMRKVPLITSHPMKN
jgi:hypothetical protein